ncbi:NACHT domain-containing protein [Candidatus Leptofilum sp.]|uniref:NACHT domain-containing protein n=1 Tax=Candidatus Leptofilum sp. TaxID=3241576 RepID=UPI003B590FE4
MAQSPPENQDFLSKTVESVKDMEPPIRFIIVFFALLVFVFVSNALIPDEFVLLVYLLPFVGLLVYLIWEFQQWKVRESERRDAHLENKDVRDHELEKAKLEYEYKDRQDKRDYDLEKRKIAQESQQSPPDPAKKKETVADSRFAYLDWLKREVSQLSLQGVDPDATEDEAEGTLNLDQIYTALLTAEPESPEKEMSPERLGRPEKRISAVAQLNQHSRLVLLGDPGSGKSTFINFVAMCLTYEALDAKDKGLQLLTAPLPDDEGNDQEERQPWGHGTLIPLRIILRDFAARGLPDANKHATVDHLWRFVEAELAQDELSHCLTFLKAQFEAGKAILLLDGLDEVPEADKRRQQLKEVVDAFALKYPDCRIVVTSRTYAYQKQAWELQQFRATVLQPFSVGQIRRFVDGWYAYTAGRRNHPEGWAANRAQTLKDAILSQKNLYELAVRPLLLTLMASLHAWRRGELPSDRQELYEDSVDLLLNRWERRQRVWDGEKETEMQPSLVEWLKTDRTKVRDVLNKLAYEAHVEQGDREQTADIPQKKLLDELGALSNNPNFNPRQLEKYLRDRAGLIAARGDAVYTFPHRTFQEYLAACHFIYNVNSGYPDSVPQMARMAPNTWREVLLLAAAMEGANRVWNLVDALSNYTDDLNDEADLWGRQLAGQMLHETIDPQATLNLRNQRLRQRVQTGLERFMASPHMPATERAIAGASLAFLGETRLDVACVVPEMVEVPAGPFLMGSDKQKDSDAFDREMPQDEVALSTYKIGKYPVTNAQFAHFVADGGYENESYWTKAGWAEKEKQGWQEPRYREDARLNQANQPVVGVSWYESVAYCNWLKATTERDFRLPSEAMWAKAARGTQGLIYPWGDEWQPENLNWSGSNINWPSAVGIFPAGKSPYGAFDMCGNVLEWCSTVYEEYPFKERPYLAEIEAEGRRCLRGGAFDLNRRVQPRRVPVLRRFPASGATSSAFGLPNISPFLAPEFWVLFSVFFCFLKILPKNLFSVKIGPQ